MIINLYYAWNKIHCLKSKHHTLASKAHLILLYPFLRPLQLHWPFFPPPEAHLSFSELAFLCISNDIPLDLCIQSPSCHSDLSLVITYSKKPYLTSKSKVDSCYYLTCYFISFLLEHFLLSEMLLFICLLYCLSHSTKRRKSVRAETLICPLLYSQCLIMTRM